MRLEGIIIILSLLVFITGCKSNIAPKEGSNIFIAEQTANYCALTASDQNYGRFLMVQEIFSHKIPCKSNYDCFDFLLKKEEFRSLAPEFEPYLSCEESQENPIKI